jgi:glycosyltransferase involved in cell wall biosynthesis
LKLVHVLTVSSSLDFLRGQLRYMAEHEIDVHLVASPDGGTLATFAEAEGATAHGVAMTRAMTPLADARALWRLYRLLGQLAPDVVHAGTPKGGFLGIVAASARGVPVRIYHMHGIRGMTAQGWRRGVLMTTEWLACRLSTRVLCVSASTRDTALGEGLCPPHKIVVLGAGSCNGVDARGRFDPDRIDDGARAEVRRRLGIPHGAPVIGFVGRIVKEKGIGELAAAWEQLAAAFPEAHLVIVGPLEREDPVPPAVVEALRSHPRVHFVAPVTETGPYYGVMDVVVLPTYREGLPNVPLEAAAMRLPVVASRVTGCVDAVVDGVTGTLVPVAAVVPLAQAIATYLRDPSLRAEHGRNGRERVLRDFTPQAIWKGVLELYQGLVRAPPVSENVARPR